MVRCGLRWVMVQIVLPILTMELVGLVVVILWVLVMEYIGMVPIGWHLVMVLLIWYILMMVLDGPVFQPIIRQLMVQHILLLGMDTYGLLVEMVKVILWLILMMDSHGQDWE